MRRFLSKVIFSCYTLLGVYLVLFFLFQILSVNAVWTMIGQGSSKETEQAIARAYHLHLPTWQRLAIHLNDLSPISIYSNRPDSPIYFDSEIYNATKGINIGEKSIYIKLPYLGRSMQSQELVGDLLWQRFKITLILSLFSIIISSVLGIALGLLAAYYYNQWQDKCILLFSTLGVSAPSFFIGILLALTLGYYWSEFTGLCFKGSLIEYNDIGEQHYRWKNLILPLLALSWRPLAIITQITRNSMLDVLQEDYIRTAQAKGLSTQRVFWKHGFFNAINPVITSISGWFGSLLAGAYFIEIIFDIKGLGALTVNALLKYDIPVVMGASLYIAAIFIFISLAIDYLYRWFDPRIKLS